MKNKGWIWYVFLCLYHIVFTVLAYRYVINHSGDAYHYWHLTGIWTDYVHIGTDVIKCINYPLVKFLNLPYWAGFLIHSTIGLVAIIELYRFSVSYIRPLRPWIGYLLYAIFLSPNLHFWTAILGKEPIVILAIVWIIVHISQKKIYHYKLLVGILLLTLIRPHVALFLILSIVITAMLSIKEWNIMKRISMLLGAVCCFGLYLMTLKLLNRNPFDISYILERNDASLLAFKRAGSYVPMITYNWFERIFALNFRPLFYDSHNLWAFVLSTENFLSLILIAFTIFFLMLNYKAVKLTAFVRLSIIFFLIASLFFIQRYSCLGIFVRTKVMYMPFLFIAMVKILDMSLHQQKFKERF